MWLKVDSLTIHWFNNFVFIKMHNSWYIQYSYECTMVSTWLVSATFVASALPNNYQLQHCSTFSLRLSNPCYQEIDDNTISFIIYNISLYKLARYENSDIFLFVSVAGWLEWANKCQDVEGYFILNM